MRALQSMSSHCEASERALKRARLLSTQVCGAALIMQQASIPPAQNKMLSITLDLTMRALEEKDYHSNFLRLLNQALLQRAQKSQS